MKLKCEDCDHIWDGDYSIETECPECKSGDIGDDDLSDSELEPVTL